MSDEDAAITVNPGYALGQLSRALQAHERELARCAPDGREARRFLGWSAGKHLFLA